MPHAPDLTGYALDDRYELHAVIGEGAFGRVYRGVDRRLARPVAVKVIKPWWTEDPAWVGSFEREAQLLARVSDPGIVQIFDVGHAPEGLYYVSELVDGESLASRIRRGPLPAWEACALAEQLCRALAQAHAQRIVHRDVKPANILISDDGRVKIGDFGIARLAEGTSDGAPATVVGTPRYMAPEQARGLPTTPATDVYSVGIVLYEMVAGEPPFQGNSAVELALRHMQDSPPELPAGTPRPLIAVINRALAKKPGKRYRNAGEMAAALADAQRSAEPKRARSGPAVLAGPRARAAARSRRPGPDRTPASAASASTSGPVPVSLATEPLSMSEVLGEPAVAKTALLDRPADRPADRADETRVEPPRSPRRNVNPAARRRRIALLGFVLLLVGGMAGAALILAPASKVTVPDLSGQTQSSARTRLQHAHLHAVIAAQYSSSPAGTVIAETPHAGQRVKQGTTIRVVLSKGPKPVEIPLVISENATNAASTLRGLGLHTKVVTVPAPGQTPGIVTSTHPGPGVSVLPGSLVTLDAAEVPRWRKLTVFSATGPAHSVPFQIRGSQWRVLYTMNSSSSCSFLFLFCSGPPHAQVDNVGNGAPVTEFDLNNGTNQSQTIHAGPGTYQLTVATGSDHATYSVEIDDYY